jgi:hypothetical protein
MINQLTRVKGKSDYEVEEKLDNKLNEIIETQKRKIPLNGMRPKDVSLCIEMETLVKEKLLVCRHKALLAASLIAHLVDNGILPKGTVRQYRSDLVENNGHVKGAHSWSVYRNSETGEIWICDPRGRDVFKLPADNAKACKALGEVTIADMVSRLDFLDGLQPLMISLNSNKLSSVVKASYQEGGKTTQHVRISCLENPRALQALTKALSMQNINFERASTFVLLVKSDKNPTLFSFDFEKLLKDFNQELVNNRRSPERQNMPKRFPGKAITPALRLAKGHPLFERLNFLKKDPQKIYRHRMS